MKVRKSLFTALIVSSLQLCVTLAATQTATPPAAPPTAQSAPAPTPAATGTLRGQVTDPSGAAIANANVVMTPAAISSSPITAQANGQGLYEFKGLAAGQYSLTVVAQGFSVYENDNVVITTDQPLRLNVPMAIEVEQQKVQVSDTAPTVDVNPANNAGAITISGKELEALPDDPDELLTDLQALAGPSAGPTAGELPPKSSIREIRVNQNPFSSEYDKLGYGRIEIFTKPGTDKYHGQFMVLGNTAAFNARNPFEILPAGVSPPGYNSEQYSGNIGGPLNEKTSFYFTIDRRNIGALGVVSSTVVCGDQFLLIPCAPAQNNFSIVPFSDAVTNPQTRTNLSPRIDYQLTPSNTLMGRYQYFRDVETNNGVGQFTLAQQGTNTLETEQTLQLTDTQTINPSTINEIRFQYLHDNSFTNPVSTAASIDVSGAFNGMGSGGGAISGIQNHYEIQDTVYK